MINRFALSCFCIELDRNEIFRFFGLYILLTSISVSSMEDVGVKARLSR